MMSAVKVVEGGKSASVTPTRTASAVAMRSPALFVRRCTSLAAIWWQAGLDLLPPGSTADYFAVAICATDDREAIDVANICE